MSEWYNVINKKCHILGVYDVVDEDEHNLFNNMPLSYVDTYPIQERDDIDYMYMRSDLAVSDGTYVKS